MLGPPLSLPRPKYDVKGSYFSRISCPALVPGTAVAHQLGTPNSDFFFGRRFNSCKNTATAVLLYGGKLVVFGRQGATCERGHSLATVSLLHAEGESGRV